MKITTNTINILKNFSKINPSILIEGGNFIWTVSPIKTIMGKAKVDTDFPSRFALYDLNRFISVLTLFSDPELTFEDNCVSITDGVRKTKYYYTDENNIKTPPTKKIVLPSEDVKFTITNEQLREVEKALGVLGLPEIVFVGDGEKISIQAADSNKKGSDYFSITIGDTDKEFKAVFKAENIKILPGEYEVVICSRGISWFVGKDIEYWITVESNSEFN